MAKVLMYSTNVCPYCMRAEKLLQRKGVTDLEKIYVDLNQEEYENMLSRTNGLRTVPQIFIDGAHIGGCDELFALDHAGKLDAMLTSGKSP